MARCRDREIPTPVGLRGVERRSCHPSDVSYGANARVGGSISAQFGGVISLQGRSAFELRDYPRKEMLAGTLCLRR